MEKEKKDWTKEAFENVETNSIRERMEEEQK